MVGSGFSRCALKSRPDVGDPPLWDELASQMYDRLYPQGDRGSQLGESAETEAIRNPLRLAQEYEAAFGRTDLRRLMQKLIRDEDFEPGESHFRLLRLPWHDVFTTNWDTLLERTSARVTEHDYSLARNIDDIPIASQPRIVKLHGSLTEQDPPILTEDDYRTYPTRFAPFVNTVQQAMMETVFCLIGFSGYDPNFLHWSGWVRDNLGNAAPKIYLAGFLGLSPHRRRMLEDRGVVPIDVARHPKAQEWPEHLRHRRAVDWVLHTLEAGEPYDFVDWPSPSSEPKPEVPEYLQPVVEVPDEQPRAEPGSHPQVDPKDRQERIRETLEVWTHNRRLYPGWLAFPITGERDSLSARTDSWEPQILSSLPHFAPVERLNAVRELVWRREILLEPISHNLESAAEGVLSSIDCKGRTIDGVADSQTDWSAVREAWRIVAVALVKAARFHLDGDLFNQRINALSPFIDDLPEVSHQIKHERCLWAIYSMDLQAWQSLLEGWPVEHCDPIWMIRKASMLREADQDDEAAELVKHGLYTIRSIRDGERSVAGASREGWALWSELTWKNQQAIGKKWDELAPLKCDALLEKDLILRKLGGGRDKQEAPLFDLGHRRVQGSLFSGAYPEAVAYRAMRLAEVAGLPPAVAAEVLSLAADKIASGLPELAIRLVLRVCNYEKDDTLMRVVSRTRVAALPSHSAARLSEICKGVIKYALPRVIPGPRPGAFWIERMRVAMEVLSRLVLRLTPDVAESVLDIGLDCYRSYQVSQEHWLHDPVGSVLKRSWEALPPNRRNCRALDLLGAPIVGMDNFTAAIEDNYPDPGTFLQAEDIPSTRTSDNDERLQDVISVLIRGLHGDGEARKRASIRISSVAFCGILSEAESAVVAHALWSKRHTRPDSLPDNTNLYDWAFLLLPEPTLGLAERRFRLKWLSGDISKFQESTRSHTNTVSVTLGTQPLNPARIEDVLWNLGAALSELRDRDRSLQLTDDQRRYVVDLVGRWANMDVPSRPLSPLPFQDEALKPTRRALQGLAPILLEFAIPKTIAERLYEKIMALPEPKMPAFGLIHGLVKVMDDRFDELVMWLRMGLVSTERYSAESAVLGLHSWLKASAGADSALRPPPDDLVREIGFVIAARRHASLPQALRLVRWVFDEGTLSQRQIICELALHGLRYLAEELRYDRDHDENVDVPLLRWFCAQLAQSMAQRGLQDDPTVAKWLELAEQDPLPEVRFAMSPAIRTEP